MFVSDGMGEAELDFDHYEIPSLVLNNVIARNFLYDYQALIYVEKDNFIVTKDLAGDKTVLHFGNYKADASITIENSQFVDCSFSLGMIYLPSQKFLKPSAYDIGHRYGAQYDIVLRYQDN